MCNHTLAMQNWVSILNGISLKKNLQSTGPLGSGPQAVEWAVGHWGVGRRAGAARPRASF